MYKQIEQLNSIISKIDNYEKYSIDDCLKILENINIKNYLNKIFKNISYIEDKEIIFFENIVIDLIKLYCEQNNIRYIETIQEEYEESKISDSNLKLYLRDIKKYPLLSKEKELELIKDYKENKTKESKDIIICSNQKLIFKYIYHRNVSLGFFLDLVQEGNLALLEALEKFDLGFNCRFSTYSYWYVTRNINNAINLNCLINKPREIKESEVKILAYINEVITLENRKPTEEELCKKFKIKLKKLKRILKDVSVVSLNESVLEDELTELIEFIPDKYILLDDLENREICKLIFKELDKTNLKNINDILKLRYEKDLKVDEIAEMYGVRKQTINAKIKKAQEKVRKMDKFKDLTY